MLKIKITQAVVYSVQSKWPTSAGPRPDNKLSTNQKELQQKTLDLHNLRLPLMKSSPIMLKLDYGKVSQVPLPLDFSLCNLELLSMLHFTKLSSPMAFVFTKQ